MSRRVWILLILSIAVLSGFFLAVNSGYRVVVKDEGASPFSGTKAYSHVEHLVGLGPRSPGSESISLAREYIYRNLNDMGLPLIKDNFTAMHRGVAYEMQNIIAVIPGETEEIIALGGHYDTKEIPGANDGGSSTGLLLEMARVLRQRPLSHTIWLIFFDGEDTGDGYDTMFYGSKHLAGEIRDRADRPRWLILVDMIGDEKLTLSRDRNSDPELVEFVWSKAEEIGYGRHFRDSQIAILDDHIPFVEIGIPSCVLIDFKYGPANSYWHTQEDDMDKIHENSLKAIGDVVYSVVGSLDAGGLDSRD
jgi:Zn-dependent M28 family amino/carboxypeptidase